MDGLHPRNIERLSWGCGYTHTHTSSGTTVWFGMNVLGTQDTDIIQPTGLTGEGERKEERERGG